VAKAVAAPPEERERHRAAKAVARVLREPCAKAAASGVLENKLLKVANVVDAVPKEKAACAKAGNKWRKAESVVDAVLRGNVPKVVWPVKVDHVQRDVEVTGRIMTMITPHR
jgi:hypothetical protein